MLLPSPALHPDVEALAFLLGTWTGEGRGEYPTIAPFAYRETVTFQHVGKPFFAYAQKTWDPSDGRPLHAETGYLRAPGGLLELVLAHPTGLLELATGTFVESAGGGVLDLRATVSATPSAKRVDGVERTISVDGDVLGYQLRMAAVGLPMTHHLAAELRRAAPAAPRPGPPA